MRANRQNFLLYVAKRQRRGWRMSVEGEEEEEEGEEEEEDVVTARN